MLHLQGDECRSMADFGAPTLSVKYSFSNFSFKVVGANSYVFCFVLFFLLNMLFLLKSIYGLEFLQKCCLSKAVSKSSKIAILLSAVEVAVKL